jgi:hypothetical protein
VKYIEAFVDFDAEQQASVCGAEGVAEAVQGLSWTLVGEP